MKRRDKLISFRKQRNWYQKDVVLELKEKYNFDISVSYYGMIEQGVRTPKLDLAIAIASVFESTVVEIFFGDQYNKMLCDRLQPTGTERS